MKKLILFFSHIFKLIRAYKMRYALLLLGIVIGLFGFSFGDACINSYYSSLLKEISIMPDNKMYVSVENEYADVTREMMTISKSTPVIERISSNGDLIHISTDNNKYVEIRGKLHGISMTSDVYTKWDSIYGLNLSEQQIVAGRNITQAEINKNEKVCLIDQFTAEHIFNNNAIGNKIVFNYWGNRNNDEKVVEYEVVGVIKDDYYSKKTKEMMKKQLEEYDYAYIYVDIICPYNYYKFVKDYEAPTLVYMWDKSQEGSRAVNQIIKKYQNKYDFSPLVDKDVEMVNAEKEIKNIKYTVKYISIVLLCISGIFILSVMWFSLKERIYEIGVKKAFGANSYHILLQFFSEIIILILISSIIAGGLTKLGLKLSENFIIKNVLSDYYVTYKISNVIKMFLIGLVQGCIFMCIPTVKYSFMNVSNLIKRE